MVREESSFSRHYLSQFFEPRMRGSRYLAGFQMTRHDMIPAIAMGLRHTQVPACAKNLTLDFAEFTSGKEISGASPWRKWIVDNQDPMIAGAIVIIVIAASGVLMMRFRKRWLARINIAFTNRITGLFAGWLPGFGILTHVGRKSGKVYRTPVNVFRVPNGFIIALTYGSQSEWVKNVLAAGGCELRTCAKKYQLSAPKVVLDPTRQRFPLPVRIVLTIVGADEHMEFSIFS